eukprot:gene3686-6500_t
MRKNPLFLLCFIIFNVLNAQGITNFLQKNLTGEAGRFTKIFLPKKHYTEFIPEITDEHIWVAPILPIFTLSTSIELCQDAKNQLTDADSIFNTTTNFCSEYFCGANEPLFSKNGKNNTLPSSFQKYSNNLHIMAHRLCFQCEHTKTQNFRNKTCPWVSTNYCKCTSSSECIYYEWNLNLCFDYSTGHFYHKDNFVHKVLFWVYNLYSSIILLVFSVILFLFNFVFIFLPEVFTIKLKLKQKKDSHRTFCQKLSIVFSLSNQIRFFNFLISVICILMSIADLALLELFLKSFIIPICFGVIFICFILISILWFHFIEEMKSYQHRKLSIRSKIIYGISVICIPIIFMLEVIFYALYGFVDDWKRKIFIFFVGSWGIWFPFLFFLSSLLISISGIVIAIKIYTNPVLKEDYGNIFNLFIKLKFTRFMLIANLNMMFWGILTLNLVFQFLIAKDYISNAWYMLTFPVYSVGVISTSFIILFGMLNWKDFKFMITSCVSVCSKKK